MKYSIIIAVYNRIDEVAELLASAELLDFPREEFELLFIDDGSTDGFVETVKTYSEATDLQILLYCQENKGPGEARNHGMRRAKGKYFIFVDSDCIFPPHWLRAIDDAILANDIEAFGGADTFHPDFNPLLKAINYSMTSFIGTGGTRGSKKSIGKFYPRSFNMGIHRKIFEKIGGMNKLRHGQDMDYSARIYEAGYKVGLIEDAFIYHKRRTSLWKFFKQIFNWGVARINLGRLHPTLLKPLHFLPSLIVIGIVLSLLLALIFKIFIFYKVLTLAFLAVCAFAFLQAFSIYRSLSVASLSVLTLNIQVFAYGLGLLWALPQALRGSEATGFVKHYYRRAKK